MPIGTTRRHHAGAAPTVQSRHTRMRRLFSDGTAGAAHPAGAAARAAPACGARTHRQLARFWRIDSGRASRAALLRYRHARSIAMNHADMKHLNIKFPYRK